MDTETPIYQRLAELRKELNLTQDEVANAVSLPRAALSKIENGKQEIPPALLLFYNRTHNISGEWILSGAEPKFKGEEQNESSTNTPALTTPQHIEVTWDTGHNVTVPIVNQAAAANYLAGYQSQEFFERLEPMSMPRYMLNGGQHAVFQVRGESMEPTFFDSEYVICTKVNKGDWQHINDFDVFVVVSSTYGVQLKRVKNRLREKGFMRFRSDNRQHKDFSLSESEILELWRFQWKLSPFAVNRAEQLYKKVDDMEEQVQDMQDMINSIMGHLSLTNPFKSPTQGK